MPGKTAEDNDNMPVYKDTVVIGNGPSAISLSYMLSGNVAFYKGASDDDLLHNRMSYLQSTPIVLQDLKELSQGLEGRSTNSVSLLFDALAHPNADLGGNNPSLLEWKKREDLKVDHVVIGPDVPGGAWRAMDKEVLTVSLGTWMELPNLAMSEWLASSASSADKSKVNQPASSDSIKSGDRISVGAVAEYYKDYVEKMGLAQNFVNRAQVTRVRKVSCGSLRSAASGAAKSHHSCAANSSSIPAAATAANRRHESETLFKFSEDDVIRDAEDDVIDDVSSTTPTSSSGGGGGFLSSSISSSFTATSSGGGGRHHSSSSPIAAAAAASVTSSRNSTSTSSPEHTEVDHFDQNEYLQWQNLPEEETYALSCTPMGHLMRVQAEANAMEKCCLRRSSDYSASALTCTSWNPICNPALFTTPSGGGSGCGNSGEAAAACGSPMVEAQRILDRVYGSSNDSHHHLRRCPLGGSRAAAGGRRAGNVTCPKDRPYLWEVSGYTWGQGQGQGNQPHKRHFKYLAQNVVMACGSDMPNKMDIPGEDLPFVLHSLKELETKLAGGDLAEGDRVMVVGAGLSAADAVLTAMENNLRVLHMFRRGAQDKNLIFRSLPPKLYPEYHRVHQMMARGREHEADYQPLERQHLIEIFPDKRVKFHGDVTTETVDVSYVVVLIGGRPNLDFFDAYDDGAVDPEALGVVPNAPVSKNNPVDINIYTFESVKHPGLYAMGPLVGDNFVRFLQGGALAITANILKQKTATTSQGSGSQ